MTNNRVPLVCRLNLHHWWRVQSNDDGGRYRRCAKCGKDKDGTPSGPGGWPAGFVGGS